MTEQQLKKSVFFFYLMIAILIFIFSMTSIILNYRLLIKDINSIQYNIDYKAPERFTLEKYKTITAYCLNKNLMASGKEVYNGAIACPRKIPLGTNIIINNTKYICEDRLSLKYDNRFDIWMKDCNDAIQFGKQKLPIIILQKQL